ncbi:AAA family ATPase [Pluralibacter sp.]|uniref:McrB family protein n=1 Tax=Pluralibacter sp. TaxID=1920032 RepID=UPI0025DE24DD|nr:AAA family ATPase [Pluralibacter sp.]MBV8041914.1 AAA family ATPase [Pluralibacter sp.]
MVQDPQSLAPFFRQFAQQNSVHNSEWGPGYREIASRVQREKPDFSDQTIQDLWYTRDNKVASLRQGGMSHEEFIHAKDDLRELTKLIASGCTIDVFEQAHKRLQSLKDQGKLKKFYRALCSRTFAAFYPTQITSIINEGVFFRVYSYCNNYFQLGLPEVGEWSPLRWFTLNLALKTRLRQALDNDPDDIELNMSLWHLYELEIEDDSNAVMESSSSTSDDEGQGFAPDDILPPKNLILYGPPGTGKTYKTIEIAVRACEPEAFTRLDGKEKTERRNELKKIYDSLTGKKRVRFITFHQSFGYEEFIEGLRAETNDDGSVRYDIKPGVFKQICEDATFGDATVQLALDDAIEQFKAQCAEQGEVTLKTTNGSLFRVSYANNSTFRIFPSQSKNDQLSKGYAASIENIRRLYQGEKENIYNISYVCGILNYLIQTWHIPATPESSAPKKKQNYVLIIDEINRGNISKIFGELITLIETSKRTGESEALSVSLPYSSKPFSVPNNLFLIGTMNTADRSLTALDTALRRRFEFEALMPDTTVLSDTVVQGIDLKALLTTLNARIQALYDSEHTLGHAFFMSVVQEKDDPTEAFKKLKRVMKNKVLPLLEEYFYNDWQKIRLVLGDNQKKEDSLRFVRSVENQNDLATLFGQTAIDDLQEAGVSYQLCKDNDSVWDNPRAYQQIYDAQTGTTE